MEIDSEILSRMGRFKSDLSLLNSQSLYNKYITWGDCYIMKDDDHNYLRERIAEHFQINPGYVLVVGSAKLGFSIARGKRYRPFIKVSDVSRDSTNLDSDGENIKPSDIDIAIISPTLFDSTWQKVFDYWADGGSIDYSIWPKWARRTFNDYLFRGWLRPDKLPASSQFDLYKDWWEFFEQLASFGQYGASKIAAGIYKSWHFLEKYQMVSINECKLDFELGRDQSKQELEG